MGEAAAAAQRHAEAVIDQLAPFFTECVSGAFFPKPPIALCEHDAQLREPSQPFTT